MQTHTQTHSHRQTLQAADRDFERKNAPQENKRREEKVSQFIRAIRNYLNWQRDTLSQLEVRPEPCFTNNMVYVSVCMIMY